MTIQEYQILHIVNTIASLVADGLVVESITVVNELVHPLFKILDKMPAVGPQAKLYTVGALADKAEIMLSNPLLGITYGYWEQLPSHLPRCECGAHVCNTLHARWCPLWS